MLLVSSLGIPPELSTSLEAQIMGKKPNLKNQR